MRSILIPALCLLMLIGCGKKAAPETAPVSDATNSAAAAEGSSETAAPTIDAVLSDLTQAVRRYAMEKQRVPASLADVVSGGYLDRVPPAPAGKRFAIDPKLQVHLADE